MFFLLKTAVFLVSPWAIAFLTGLFLLYLRRYYALFTNSYTFLRCSYHLLCVYLPLWFPIHWKMREECYLGRPNSRHSRLFSVSIHHSIITSCFSKDVSLSSIRIPIRHCLPEAQKAHKTKHHRCLPRPLKRRSLFTLIALFTSALNTQQVYSLLCVEQAAIQEGS